MGFVVRVQQHVAALGHGRALARIEHTLTSRNVRSRIRSMLPSNCRLYGRGGVGTGRGGSGAWSRSQLAARASTAASPARPAALV